MSIPVILAALKSGPKTNAQLQGTCCDHGGSISRTCARLRADGRVKRIDGGGRGRPALYALDAEKRQPLPVAVARKDMLAELMAEGCPSLIVASRYMRISRSEAERTWRSIKRDLGEQAA